MKNFLFYFPCKLFCSLISLGAHLPCFPSWSLTKHQFSSVQLLSRVRLFASPWTAAHQVFLSITNSQSLLKLTSIELVRPSNHLIFCYPLLLPPSIFANIRVFSNELVLCIRWPKYWSFSFSISSSNEYSGLISFRMDWLDILPPSLGFSRQEHWSGLPSPSPMHENEKWKWSHSVVSDS